MDEDIYVLSKCSFCQSGFLKVLLFPYPFASNLVIRAEFLAVVQDEDVECDQCGKSGTLAHVTDSTRFENRGEMEVYAYKVMGCHKLLWVHRQEAVEVAKSRLRQKPVCPVDPFQLHSAAKTGNRALINLLFDTVPAEFHEFLLAHKDPGNCSKTVLIEAAENGHAEIVARLEEAWNECCFLEPQVLCYQVGRYHSSMALYFAAGNGHLNVVRFLLENEPSLLRLGDNANSALFCASNSGHIEVVSYLVEERDLQIVNENDEWNAAILAAFRNEHFEIVDYFLQEGGIDTQLYEEDEIFMIKLFAPSEKAGIDGSNCWGLKFADNFLVIATEHGDEDQLFEYLEGKIDGLI